jgi:hypothetical protein
MPQRSRSTRRLNELLATSQNKSYFVGAVTVIFIVIMTMVGILPAYSAFTFQYEENNKRDQLIEKLSNKLKVSQTLSKEYDSKIAIVNYFAESFPDNPDQEGIVDLIKEMVAANKSYLEKITFNKNPTTTFIQSALEPEIQAQQVGITVHGTQSDLLTIISELESSRRILNIFSVTLDRKPQEVIDTGNATNGEFLLNVQMEYYFYKKLAETN